MESAVKDEEFKVAIASSADMELVTAILESVNAPVKGIDKMITGDQVRQKKPDPEVFLKTIDAIGIPARNCVVIEDAPDGVKAAKQSQAICIAVTNSVSADKLKEADLVTDSLAKISLVDVKSLLSGQKSEMKENIEPQE
jgi:beta-phosphoglucomutase-like phosphatase (HAD superfamily)